jgi:hypothetical protein
MKTIYIVIEQGAGIVHRAFESIKDATQFAANLQEQTGFDCYEVQSLDFVPTQLVTIQELINSGDIFD